MTTENLLTNDIPEKFRDPETGSLRADALLQSYRWLIDSRDEESEMPDHCTAAALDACPCQNSRTASINSATHGSIEPPDHAS